MRAGLDVGYSYVKAIAGAGTSKPRQVIFPSVVGTLEKARFGVHDEESGSTTFLAMPKQVQIGSGAVRQSRFISGREDRAWVESEEWYLLALAALSGLTKATKARFTVVTGLPVAFYARDKSLVRARLLGEHKVQHEGRSMQSLHVTTLKVIPQPFGALLASVMDDRGRIVDEELAGSSVGVIDVGGKTTNFLSAENLTELRKETASINVGIWDTVRAIRGWLADNCPDLDLRDHEIVDALTAREVSYYGEPVDLSRVADGVLASLADQVLAEASKLWDGGAGLSAVLLTGGGALLLSPFIRAHFRHAYTVDDPVFANTRGFYRFACWLEHGLEGARGK